MFNWFKKLFNKKEEVHCIPVHVTIISNAELMRVLPKKPDKEKKVAQPVKKGKKNGK